MSVGYVYVGVYTTVFVWSSEDNFLELIVSFHLFLDARAQTRANRLSCKGPLPTIMYFFFFLQWRLILRPTRLISITIWTVLQFSLIYEHACYYHYRHQE